MLPPSVLFTVASSEAVSSAPPPSTVATWWATVAPTLASSWVSVLSAERRLYWAAMRSCVEASSGLSPNTCPRAQATSEAAADCVVTTSPSITVASRWPAR